jgi:hypothetical protein
MDDKRAANDFDVDDFDSGGAFVSKDDLRTGPRRVRIAAVEKRESQFKDAAGRPRQELVLIFSDETKIGLRAQVNRDAVKQAYGKHTREWVGQVIELYLDPSVRNPQGQKVGGILKPRRRAAARAPYNAQAWHALSF